MKVNTKRLKANLKLNDYEKIFGALNIPIFSKGQKYWSLYTGCHHKNSLHGSPKLLFYPDSGMFQCLTQCSCSFDIISLVQRRLALLSQPSAFMDAVGYIMEVTGLEADSVQRINKPNICDWQSGLEKFVRFRQTGINLPIYDKAILTQLDTIYPQSWIDEGISIQTMAKYQIGYYARTCATTIPCFDKDGSLCGIRVRNWAQDELDIGRKYMPLILLDGSSYQFPTNDVFYGINWNWPEIERTGVVTLVEGEKSVLKADTWYGPESNVLALYGSNIGTKRRNQLVQLGVREVNLALDSDYHKIGDDEFDKFEAKIMKLAKLFQGYTVVNVVYNNLGLDGYKFSPFDFDRETCEKLFEAKITL